MKMKQIIPSMGNDNQTVSNETEQQVVAPQNEQVAQDESPSTVSPSTENSNAESPISVVPNTDAMNTAAPSNESSDNEHESTLSKYPNSLRVVKSRRKEGIGSMLEWEGEDLIPRELAIETVFGCNLSCKMCYIDHPTKRKKGIMPMDLFYKIADSMAPYADKIEQVDLWSLGEPLLDPHLFERIKYLKKKGFKGLAIASNGDLLNEDKRKKLLDSRIDTVIFSIDGITKETHEKIRVKSNFERTMNNVQEIIKMRDEGNYPTRFIVRFIRGQDNEHEWDEYVAFWNSKLSKDRRDFVASYDTHNYGGHVGGKDVDKLKDVSAPDSIQSLENRPCHFAFDALIILSNGAVAVCPADFLHAEFGLGNVLDRTPMEAFNSEAFKDLRRLHNAGNKNNRKLCKDCDILYCETTRNSGWKVEGYDASS